MLWFPSLWLFWLPSLLLIPSLTVLRLPKHLQLAHTAVLTLTKHLQLAHTAVPTTTRHLPPAHTAAPMPTKHLPAHTAAPTSMVHWTAMAHNLVTPTLPSKPATDTLVVMSMDMALTSAEDSSFSQGQSICFHPIIASCQYWFPCGNEGSSKFGNSFLIASIVDLKANISHDTESGFTNIDHILHPANFAMQFNFNFTNLTFALCRNYYRNRRRYGIRGRQYRRYQDRY